MTRKSFNLKNKIKSFQQNNYYINKRHTNNAQKVYSVMVKVKKNSIYIL